MPVQAEERNLGLLAQAVVGRTDGGLFGQPDNPLHLMWQTERFSLVHSTSQHFRSHTLLTSARQYVGGSDARYDTPLGRWWLFVSREALSQCHGLAGTAGSEQAAKADLPYGERVEQDCMAADPIKQPHALRAGRIEQIDLACASRSACKQD